MWPDEELEHEYHASQRMCRPLSDEDEWEECEGKKRCIAAQIRSERMQGQQHQAACIHTRLNQDQQHAREVTKEKGASSWLHTRPLVVQGYYLSCNEFRDAIALRMGWTPADLPKTCHCGLNLQLLMSPRWLSNNTSQRDTRLTGGRNDGGLQFGSN